LKSEIQEKNYNVGDFAQFLEWKRGKSNDIISTYLIHHVPFLVYESSSLLEASFLTFSEKGTDVDMWTMDELV
jgi:hypothetical protein